MICPELSNANCHQPPPYFACALALFSGGSAPWSCRAQRWDWLACSFLGCPFTLFTNGGYVSPFLLSGNFTGLPWNM